MCFNECADTTECTIEWEDANNFLQSMTCEEFADEHFTDCEEVTLISECKDYEVFTGIDCEIKLMYDECAEEEMDFNFRCEQWFGSEMEECTENFYEVEFWTVIREEQFLQGNEEYADLYNYLDEYHGVTDDDDNNGDDDDNGGDDNNGDDDDDDNGDDNDDDDDDDDDDEHDDECMVCTHAFDCPNHEYKECIMIECMNKCTGDNEQTCYAEWDDHDGQTHEATCDEYYAMYECDKSGATNQKDECSYEECQATESGECWVEQCNQDSKCNHYTCTRWEFSDERNYWTATDCSGAYEEEYEWGTFFHHTYNALSHYDDTWSVIDAHYCPEGECAENALSDLVGSVGLPTYIEDNNESIDEFLASEDSKAAGEVFLKDSQEAVDYLGLDLDLDFAHSLLSANDHDQLQEMIWQNMDAFWGGDATEAFD